MREATALGPSWRTIAPSSRCGAETAAADDETIVSASTPNTTKHRQRFPPSRVIPLSRSWYERVTNVKPNAPADLAAAIGLLSFRRARIETHSAA
jgi:hypothetical protein